MNVICPICSQNDALEFELDDENMDWDVIEDVLTCNRCKFTWRRQYHFHHETDNDGFDLHRCIGGCGRLAMPGDVYHENCYPGECYAVERGLRVHE